METQIGPQWNTNWAHSGSPNRPVHREGPNSPAEAHIGPQWNTNWASTWAGRFGLPMWADLVIPCRTGDLGFHYGRAIWASTMGRPIWASVMGRAILAFTVGREIWASTVGRPIWASTSGGFGGHCPLWSDLGLHCVSLDLGLHCGSVDLGFLVWANLGLHRGPVDLGRCRPIW